MGAGGGGGRVSCEGIGFLHRQRNIALGGDGMMSWVTSVAKRMATTLHRVQAKEFREEKMKILIPALSSVLLTVTIACGTAAPCSNPDLGCASMCVAFDKQIADCHAAGGYPCSKYKTQCIDPYLECYCPGGKYTDSCNFDIDACQCEVGMQTDPC